MTDAKKLVNLSNWRKTQRGVITNLYAKMKGRNTIALDFTLEWFHSFAKCAKFERLFKEWVKSGYKKNFKPSIDRRQKNKQYSKSNIQWLTWGENRFKQRMECRRKNQEIAATINGIVVKVYKSQQDAALQTGFSQGNIGSVLRGNRHTCGGFGWIKTTSELKNKTQQSHGTN